MMQDTKSYMRSWKISKYICAGIGIYSQEEIESFIGETVTFSDEAANYFEEQRIDKMNLGGNRHGNRRILKWI